MGMNPWNIGHDITRRNNGKTIREGSLCQMTPNFPLLGIMNPIRIERRVISWWRKEWWLNNKPPPWMEAWFGWGDRRLWAQITKYFCRPRLTRVSFWHKEHDRWRTILGNAWIKWIQEPTIERRECAWGSVERGRDTIQENMHRV